MYIVPNYYKNFKCIAAECRHSCCKGWEIDIDEESHRRYGSVTGSFGEKLRHSIYIDEDGAHFVLNEDERCPFLQSDGLCEMILTIGEENLCQICADHPRFRSFLPGRTEMGLGLCCEAAARLILTYKDKFELVGEGTDDEEIRELLNTRKALFDILTDRSKTMRERFTVYLSTVGTELPEIGCDFYSELEIMDEDWKVKLNCPKAGSLPDRDSAELELAFEQLAVYFLFRHYAGAYDDELYIPRALYPIHAVSFIRKMLYAHGDVSIEALIDLSRLYSAEIEYSDENLDAVLDELSFC